MLFVNNMEYLFNDISESKWFTCIRQLVDNQVVNTDVVFGFSTSIYKEELSPLHLVTLANVIQYFWENNNVYISHNSNKELCDYVYSELKFSEYWSKGKNHVDANANILNLWRLVDTEKDLYAKNVEEYFKRNYFKDHDLSVISQIMTEAFYNVFDHANADNNAFSFISYDSDKKLLSAAISDFGVGIAKSVRNFKNSNITDKDALTLAIEDNFTVCSTKRNHGLGLSNILNGADSVKIISGDGVIIKKLENTEIKETTYSFPGTLIYFDVDLASTEKEEILNEFDW